MLAQEVLKLPGQNLRIVYSEASGWGWLRREVPEYAHEKGHCMPFLPLLELAPAEAKCLINRAILSVQLRPLGSVTFPFDEVLVCALEFGPSQWPELALSWLDQGHPVSEQLEITLSRVSNQSNMPQAIRHRALKFAMSRHVAPCT